MNASSALTPLIRFIFPSPTSKGRLWVGFWSALFFACMLALTEQATEVLPALHGLNTSLLLALAFFTSALTAALVLATQGFHGHLTQDISASGVQKIHQGSVPRIGGLGLFLALLALCYFTPTDSALTKLLLCASPIFAVGLFEDITRQASVKLRLTVAFASGLLAVGVLQVTIAKVGVPLFDLAFGFQPWAWAFTAFAICGFTNAINLIDGLNGLASGVSVMLAAALAYVAWVNNAQDLAFACFALCASLVGFWVFNFPIGKLFLGDGGAYLLGFFLACVAIMLPSRSSNVSEWFVLSIIAYPVVEVLFSIARRKLTKTNPGLPDCDHLHQLVQRYLLVLAKAYWGKESNYQVNSQATPFLWLFCGLSLFFAFEFNAKDMPALGFAATALLYGASYLWLKWQLNRKEKLFL